MKKLFMSVAVAGLMLSAASLQGNVIAEKIALWPVNLVVDALDTFTVNVGVGPVADASLQLTSALWVGGNVGMSYKIYKNYNRQYGLGVEDGYYWEFISIGQENRTVCDGTALIDKYTVTRAGMPDWQNRIYDIQLGSRDYYAIGGSLGLLVIGEVYIHPVELADFVTGIFFLDIKGDDIVGDDFR